MTATLHVCITCRAGLPVEDGIPCPGARLLAAIDGPAAPDAPEGLRIVPVECLSACNQGPAIALTGPGRWTYVYGRLAEADVADILAGAALYAATADGLVPWRDRPAVFRKNTIARIPPLELSA